MTARLCPNHIFDPAANKVALAAYPYLVDAITDRKTSFTHGACVQLATVKRVANNRVAFVRLPSTWVVLFVQPTDTTVDGFPNRTPSDLGTQRAQQFEIV